MKKLPILLTCLVLFSCNNYITKSIYSNPEPVYHESKKVLVIGIAPSRDEGMERVLERDMICNLSNNGFEAVSYVDAFNMYDMAMVSEDAVGFILEQNNIDYVLTVSYVNTSQCFPPGKQESSLYLASSYFNHVRKYRQSVALPASFPSKIICETILFDVHSCNSRLVLQTRYLKEYGNKKQIAAITRDVTEYINQFTPNRTRPLKGF